MNLNSPKLNVEVATVVWICQDIHKAKLAHVSKFPLSRLRSRKLEHWNFTIKLLGRIYLKSDLSKLTFCLLRIEVALLSIIVSNHTGG